MVSVAFPNRPFNLRDNVTLVRQDIANNRSLMHWELWIDKTGYSPTYSDGSAARWLKINGSFVHEFYGNGFDFRTGNNFLIGSGDVWVPHNADGTKSFTIQAQANFALLGLTPLLNNPSYVLPTIPRASKATFSGGATFDAGTAVTINTNRHSSSFTHTLTLVWGGTSTTIATGVGTSRSWTPPLSLLSSIPNATSGTGYVRTTTYSGSTQIGRYDTTFTLRAPAAVKPTVSSVTVTDQNPDVANIVGRFVQNLSVAKLTVNAAGSYGSTIKSGTAKMQGVTVASGGEIPVTSSGNVPITATVTDSRGRTGTGTATLSVLPYSKPAVSSYRVRRCTPIGTPSEDGAYLRIDLTAAISSLVNSTQRNAMTIRVRTRARGTSAWTARNVITPGTLTYNTWAVVSGGGIYATTSSWEVRVEVYDKFGVYIADTIVATIGVALDMNGTRVGIGKIWERGALDVGGDVYMSGELRTGTVPWARLSGVPIASIGTPNGDDPPASYPLGVSYTSVGTGFPASIGTLVTVNHSDYRCFQQFYDRATNAGMWYRTSNGGSAWTAWQKVVSENHKGLPFATAHGRFNVTHAAAAANATGITITLPAGRFTQPPIAQINLNSAPNGSQKDVWRIYAQTTTTLTAGVWSGDGTAPGVAHTDTLAWSATQMTESSAAG